MTNPNALAFVSNAGPASRTFGNHIGEYVYNVKSFGAFGDNVHDDTAAIQLCLDSAFLDHTVQNWSLSADKKLVYFPAGIYKTTSELMIPLTTHGGMIFGAGMGASVINNVTSGSIVINTQGLLNSTMRDMSLWSAGGAGSICYRWDELPASGGGLSKECVWINVGFRGAETGLKAGDFSQCDVALVLNCVFKDHAVYGINATGGNVLSWVVMGGRCENCDIGIRMAGNIPLIQGVYFDNIQADIANNSFQTVTVIGCYSNSSVSNSAIISSGTIKVIGCMHTGTSGDFARLNAGPGDIAICMDASATPRFMSTFATAAGAVKGYIRNCDVPATVFTGGISTFASNGGVVKEGPF